MPALARSERVGRNWGSGHALKSTAVEWRNGEKGARHQIQWPPAILPEVPDRARNLRTHAAWPSREPSCPPTTTRRPPSSRRGG
jgi:hypothetical protein